MQTSTARHSSKISIGLTAFEFAAFLPLSGTGSGVLAVATCTVGVCTGGVCGKSVDAAWSIDAGSSGDVAVLVAIKTSLAAATSELPTAALPTAVACGGSVGTTSAESDGVWWSPIGVAPEFSILAEPEPARLAAPQPAKPTVGQNATATAVNRRRFMILASKGSIRAESSDSEVRKLSRRPLMRTSESKEL